jgi:hypothetical protein
MSFQQLRTTSGESVDYHWRVGAMGKGEGDGQEQFAGNSETNNTPHKCVLLWTRTGGHTGWPVGDNVFSGRNWAFMAEVAEGFLRQC